MSVIGLSNEEAFVMQDVSMRMCLFNQYGPIMTLVDVATALKYRSKESVRKAITRGSLPLDTIRIPNRKEVFVKTDDLARYIESVI